MIPTTDNLKGINPELVKIVSEFNANLESWKEKFKNIPFLDFIVIPEIEKFTDNYQLMREPGHYSHDNFNCIGNFHTDEELIENVKSGLIFRAATFLLKPQWIADNPWPECYGEDCPQFMQISFYTDNCATITSTGYGLVDIVEADLMVKDYEFSGTWTETFNHLIYIVESAMKNLKIE